MAHFNPYLGCRRSVYIALQRRCITPEQHSLDRWTALCANHSLLSLLDFAPNPGLKTVLYVIDLTCATDIRFPRATYSRPIPTEHGVVPLTREGVVMDFIGNPSSVEPPSGVTVADCLFKASLSG